MNLRNYFALLLVLLSCLLSGASSRFRIFNGEVSNIEDRPYMVSLHYKMTYFCAGSLVNMETVITAAHCLRKKEKDCIQVKAGVTNIYDVGEIRTVQRLIIPSTFHEKTAQMDIAAIKVSSPYIESSVIKPIALCDTELKPATPMRVSGWGVTCEDSPDFSDLLRTTVLDIVSTQDCASSYKRVKLIIKSTMICAGLGGSDICRGDSGAPGVVNEQICAVVSAGKKCPEFHLPGIYTSLNNAEVLQFVQESMEP